MKSDRDPKKWLRKKARGGYRGFPMASIAYYGPDNTRATKVAVGVVATEGAEAVMRRWIVEDAEIRSDTKVLEEVIAFLKEHRVLSVAVTDGLLGCPHEEGIDYPEGEWCPQCSYWRGRGRFTGEMIQ